ncbi:MAG TPA: hypothetical protein VFE97_20435 [Methylomirabilota bacterium]|nr:hypothetical protein [Methylomirabilota bacterium]
MSSRRVVGAGVAAVGLFLVVLTAIPQHARAAWVNGAGTQFQVGGALMTLTPTSTGSFASPECGFLGGTSLAIVQGLKLQGVDPVLYPVALVVSCLDNNPAQLNFINTVDGKVIRQFSTTAVPSGGWAHLVHRQDKGDLLGCGGNGALHSIDFSQTTTISDGTTSLPMASPPGITSCTGLTWDAETDVIYVGTSVTVGEITTNSVVSFKEGATIPQGTFTVPCVTNGLAISGGVLLVSCRGALTINRLDKATGLSLGAFPTLTASGLIALNPDPGLGGFACDPVTLHKDAFGRDLFTDALWSRRGANGNGVVALEFPAYTCGLPPGSVVFQGAVPYSPLAAGLGAPASGQPGAIPKPGCFDTNGLVIDDDRDGLPDCWETNGVDFAGSAVANDILTLCVPVNTNGDGVTLTTECALLNQKDLFVEIDYMRDHKPDPLALSQAASTTAVKSVRAAFAAAPVTTNPPPPATGTPGIRLHMHVDEQVTFTPLSGPSTSHVDLVAFTPCTPSAESVTDKAQVVDFDTIKRGNFGTAAERGNLQKLNAKRLAFRYVVFAHNLVGTGGGGSNGSGCAEIGGDDAVVTLGSFASTTVGGVSHARGTTDQQAGTFMHEFGHTLGFGHGGVDNVNCKPNYRSVMNYTRQFAGSPIPGRRLDYSRSADPVLADPNKTGLLNKLSLIESDKLGTHPSLGPITPYFTQADTIVFGPNAWSIVLSLNSVTSIDWNRSKAVNTNAVTADINTGATSGCAAVVADVLEGQDDWSNVLYRPSAAINFAGGSEVPPEMTSDNEDAMFGLADADGLGAGDNIDCGGPIDSNGTPLFSCKHRIDIKSSFPEPKTFDQTGNVKIVIFSERSSTNPPRVWDAVAQVITDSRLKFRVGTFVVSVKVNNQGGGTCSSSDVDKDGIKDLTCQFDVPAEGLPLGTDFGIVSGFFRDSGGEERGFIARQLITVVPPRH